jgi:hypothetical protein
MAYGGVDGKEHVDLYKHGTAEELVNDTQSILETANAGSGFLRIATTAKRLVEVKFVPNNDIGYQTGFLEKWNNSILSVMVNNGSSDKPDWKHHRLEKNHNIGWRLINLNKE